MSNPDDAPWDVLSPEEESALNLVRTIVNAFRAAGHLPTLEHLSRELALQGAVALPGFEDRFLILGAHVSIRQWGDRTQVSFPSSP